MKTYFLGFLGTSLLLISSQLLAGELVYSPQNTAFGGDNASASQLLMSKAQAQDTTENPKKTTATTTQKTELEKFKESLERRVLDQIAREIVSGAFPNNSDMLDETGTFTTEDFSITVNNDNPDVVSLSIVDFSTGGETSIEIPKF